MENNTKAINTVLNSFLLRTISFFDGLRENFYHGLMLGLITIFEETHFIRDNRESGDGRYDIQLEPKDPSSLGIIIEIKFAKTDQEKKNLKQLAQTAFNQIKDKKYDTELQSRKIKHILKYGIAFADKKAEIISEPIQKTKY